MQTDFSSALTSKPFLLGQDYDTSLSQIDSYITDDVVGFGRPVELAVDKTKVKVLDDKTNYLGIAVRTNYQVAGAVPGANAGEPDSIVTANFLDAYPKGAQISVMRLGRVVVNVNTVTEVTLGTPLWFNPTNGTITAVTADPTGGDGLIIGHAVTVPVVGLTAMQITGVEINKLM